ncbi:hypothetical protein ACHAWT_009449, partial [Skeletonema menzelii]
MNMPDATMQRQRIHSSRGEKGGGLSINGSGSGQRARSKSFERPSVMQQPQQQQVAAMGETTPRIMHRSRSCGNGRCSSDVTSAQKQSRCRDFKSPERASALEYYVQSFRSLSASNNRKSPGVAGNNYGIVESDASRILHGRFQHQLPFETHTMAAKTPTISPPGHLVHPQSVPNNAQPPPPPRRSSHHAVVNSSQLPRRNAYSKGINVKNLQPPPRRRILPNAQTTETASSSSPPPPQPIPYYGVSAAASQPRPAQCLNTHERSEKDEATSRLRDLCIDILQSAKEGTSPPQRAEIKEAVVDYHRSRNSAISPRDPNFTEIPSEFSHVLTYGLARSQTRTVPQSTRSMEALEHHKQPQLYNDTNQQTVLKGRAARRSRFSEIKDEGGKEFYASESRLNTTIELGPSDDVLSCVSLPSTVDH